MDYRVALICASCGLSRAYARQFRLALLSWINWLPRSRCTRILLAQVLAASTYWNQIPEAATWATQHSYLTGDALAAAIH